MTMVAFTPSAQAVGLPLPLAGEGWGGGVSAKGMPMVDPEHPDGKVPASTCAQMRAHSGATQPMPSGFLWSVLRNHRLNGAGFRRQVPIEHFIADFVCHGAKLVIELDGGQHFSDEGERADARRSAIIEAKGFKMLRFSNHDVMINRAGVLETIAAAVAERAPTPTLPRKREREETVPAEKKQS